VAGDLGESDSHSAESEDVAAAASSSSGAMDGAWHEDRPSNFWSAEDTSPSKIEEGLRHMLAQQHAHDSDLVPARVLNLIAVVDKEWRGEIENRLDNVGRYHPSRTILCAVDSQQTTLDAWATMMVQDVQSGLTLCHEQIELTVGPQHLPYLDTICDPLVVSDIATVVWSPHGHPEAVDSLVQIAQVVLTDSVDEADERSALSRALELKENAYVVDLAWLRSTPWRERVASTFDPLRARPALFEIDAVTVRHHPSSAVAGLLFVGWLASRLGWQPSALARHDGTYHGKLHTRRHDIAVHLETVADMSVPGLAGVTVRTASGLELSLDRGPGGLTLKRRRRNGSEQQWTVMGASRGEAGILGEGVRQALLRDPTYTPALAAASAMVT
jgi:glucose-6-phosphate dehydrogenase assembly protein OpcA